MVQPTVAENGQKLFGPYDKYEIVEKCTFLISKATNFEKQQVKRHFPFPDNNKDTD